MSYRTKPISEHIQNLLHSLTLSDIEIVSALTQNFLSLSLVEKHNYIESISFYTSVHPNFTELVCLTLRECLRLDAETFINAYKPQFLFDILTVSNTANKASIDGYQAAYTFIHELCTVKTALGFSFQAETLKLLSELSNHTRLSHAPPSGLRALVVRLWCDFPATRPRHFVLIRLLLQWLARCPSGHAQVGSILRLIRAMQKATRAESPDARRVFDLELVFHFLRLTIDEKISDVAQLALVFVRFQDFVMLPVLRLFSVAEIFKLWVMLASWTPLIPAALGVQLTENLFNGTPYVLVAFMQRIFCLSTSLSSQRLAESMLRVILAKGVSALVRADAEILLEYMTDSLVQFREDPSIYRSFPELQKVVERGKRWWLDGHSPAVSITALLGPGPVEIARPDLSVVFTDLPGVSRRASIPEFYPASSSVFQGDEVIAAPGQLQVSFPSTPKGIQNFNNTCFLSSVLQAFFACRDFVTSVFQETSNVLVGKLQQVFLRLMITQHEFIEISDFLRALPAHYRSGEQQDASETTRYLLEALAGDCSGHFQGQVTHTIECLTCGYKSERAETFTDLLLSVPPEAEAFGRPVSLAELIEKLLQVETLDGDNKYFCDKCGAKRDARKYLVIKRISQYLILVLNRFSFDVNVGDFKKENTPVDVLDGCVLGDFVFKPLAVIVHEGASVNEGHYTANILSPGTDRWHAIDDTDVSEIAKVRAKLAGIQKPSDASYMVFLARDKLRQVEKLTVNQTSLSEARAVEDAAVHL